MDRSVERQKPIPYSRELSGVFQSGMFAATVMGHPEMNIGHIGISLSPVHVNILSRTGLNPEVFIDALPKRSVPDAEPKASEDVRQFMENANLRARCSNSGEVTVDHLLDAMTDPALPTLMIFKFSRLGDPITVNRKQKPRDCEAA